MLDLLLACDGHLPILQAFGLCFESNLSGLAVLGANNHQTQSVESIPIL
jgi:hypothetical protein